jgi:hypothetical protein
LSDPQPLERWVNKRDEATFEILLWRHGLMVPRLRGRIPRRDQDAEDAFPATFLVLVRKAASLYNRAVESTPSDKEPPRWFRAFFPSQCCP